MKRWIISRAFKNSFWKCGGRHSTESPFIKTQTGNIAFVLAGLHENGQSRVPGLWGTTAARGGTSGGRRMRNINKGKGTRWWSKIKAQGKIAQQGVVARRECEDFVGTLWRTKTWNLILWFVLLGYHVLISLSHVHTHSALSKNHQQRRAESGVCPSLRNTPITEPTGKLQEIS